LQINNNIPPSITAIFIVMCQKPTPALISHPLRFCSILFARNTLPLHKKLSQRGGESFLLRSSALAIHLWYGSPAFIL
jgi:hypothetical protein